MLYSKFVCDSKIKGGNGKQCKWDVLRLSEVSFSIG